MRKGYEAGTAKEKWIKWIERHTGMCFAWKHHQFFFLKGLTIKMYKQCMKTYC
jgi:hypothetical protein